MLNFWKFTPNSHKKWWLLWIFYCKVCSWLCSFKCEILCLDCLQPWRAMSKKSHSNTPCTVYTVFEDILGTSSHVESESASSTSVAVCVPSGCKDALDSSPVAVPQATVVQSRDENRVGEGVCGQVAVSHCRQHSIVIW